MRYVWMLVSVALIAVGFIVAGNAIVGDVLGIVLIAVGVGSVLNAVARLGSRLGSLERHAGLLAEDNQTSLQRIKWLTNRVKSLETGLREDFATSRRVTQDGFERLGRVVAVGDERADSLESALASLQSGVTLLQHEVTDINRSLDAFQRRLRNQVSRDLGRRAREVEAHVTTELGVVKGHSAANLEGLRLGFEARVDELDAVLLSLREQLAQVGDRGVTVSDTLDRLVAESGSLCRSDELYGVRQLLESLVHDGVKHQESIDGVRWLIQGLSIGDQFAAVNALLGEVTGLVMGNRGLLQVLEERICEFEEDHRAIDQFRDSCELMHAANVEQQGVLLSMHNRLQEVVTRSAETVQGELQALRSQLCDPAASVKDIRSDISRQTVELRKQIWVQTQQVEALLHLTQKVKSKRILPQLGRWAIDARSLLHLMQVVEDHRPSHVLELGSGTSTLWLAYMAQELGFHITTVDHQGDFLEKTVENLRDHGLLDRVTPVLAPLGEVLCENEVYTWYRLDDLPPVMFDLLVVDGPPNVRGQNTRFPALPALYDRLAEAATVMLHDSDRPDEQEIGARWSELYPQAEVVGHVDSRFFVLRIKKEGL